MPTERRARPQGFTLVELAVVLAIVGLLLGSLMYTLAAQTEQRTRADGSRRLEEAKDLLLTFAIVNGRLPCPARCSNSPACNASGDGGDEAVSGGVCTDSYAGYLPGRAIGFSPLDSSGYALDPWGNRIRYAVASLSSGAAANHFTDAASLKANGISTTPTDVVVCASATGVVTSPPSSVSCGGVGNNVTNQNLAAAVVWTQGKNFSSAGAAGTDEAANNKHRLPAAVNNHGVFVWHEPRPSGATGGEFDDMMVWIPVGVLYGRMVAAGVLP